jgi:hypothetical protein
MKLNKNNKIKSILILYRLKFYKIIFSSFSNNIIYLKIKYFYLLKLLNNFFFIYLIKDTFRTKSKVKFIN